MLLMSRSSRVRRGEVDCSKKEAFTLAPIDPYSWISQEYDLKQAGFQVNNWPWCAERRGELQRIHWTRSYFFRGNGEEGPTVDVKRSDGEGRVPLPSSQIDPGAQNSDLVSGDHIGFNVFGSLMGELVTIGAQIYFCCDSSTYQMCLLLGSVSQESLWGSFFSLFLAASP